MPLQIDQKEVLIKIKIIHLHELLIVQEFLNVEQESNLMLLIL